MFVLAAVDIAVCLIFIGIVLNLLEIMASNFCCSASIKVSPMNI